MAILLWDKKYTETLAETLKRFRLEKPEYADEKVTYAGRLDPLAEGLLILLTGNDVHKKESFLGLDKIYEVSFILGMKTDTYDILGIPKWTSDNLVDTLDIKKSILELTKITEQTYPVYSSKTVSGKPLFMWAREGLLSEITIPVRAVQIHEVRYLRHETHSQHDMRELIVNTVDAVKGDFRQTEIVQAWNTYFNASQKKSYTLYTMKVSCSSGTYVRTLVDTLGRHYCTGACSVRITRVQVGDYIMDCVAPH